MGILRQFAFCVLLGFFAWSLANLPKEIQFHGDARLEGNVHCRCLTIERQRDRSWCASVIGSTVKNRQEVEATLGRNPFGVGRASQTVYDDRDDGSVRSGESADRSHASHSGGERRHGTGTSRRANRLRRPRQGNEVLTGLRSGASDPTKGRLKGQSWRRGCEVVFPRRDGHGEATGYRPCCHSCNRPFQPLSRQWPGLRPPVEWYCWRSSR